MIVYNKKTKEIKAIIPDGQLPRKYNDILEEDIGTFNGGLSLDDSFIFYLFDDVNGVLVRRAEDEITEIQKYGKILTEEEKEQLRQQEVQEKQKQVEKIATESFAKLSFKMMAPTLTTTQVLEFEPLVEGWALGGYIIGDIRKHLGQVWKCVQGHNNTNNPDIEPGKSPAQWSPYHSKDIQYAKPYIQPQGAHDAYMIGEYCIFENKTYKSKIASNVWTPKDYLQGWELIE